MGLKLRSGERIRIEVLIFDHIILSFWMIFPTKSLDLWRRLQPNDGWRVKYVPFFRVEMSDLDRQVVLEVPLDLDGLELCIEVIGADLVLGTREESSLQYLLC